MIDYLFTTLVDTVLFIRQTIKPGEMSALYVLWLPL